MMDLKSRIRLVAFATPFLISTNAFACNADIHSLTQPNPDLTQLLINYSCWGTYRCSLVIKKDGITQLNTTVTQGNFKSYSFDYGPGSYSVTLNSYKQVPASGGGYMGVLQDSYNVTTTLDSVIDASGSTVYQYDSLGRIKKIQRQDGTSTSYEYDSADNRTLKKTTNQSQ